MLSTSIGHTFIIKPSVGYDLFFSKHVITIIYHKSLAAGLHIDKITSKVLFYILECAKKRRKYTKKE